MFVLVFSSILLSGLLLLRDSIKNGKLYFIVFSGILLCLYSGLRAQDLQTDIPTYVKMYESYSRFSFSQIVQLFSSEIRDPSYYFTAWLFSRFFTDAQWWLAIVAAFYIVVVLVVIYKESEKPLMSLIMLLSLGYLAFVLSGLRQSIAMSFAMIAYFYIKKKKPIRFILAVIVASLFHLSAILFLIAYPLARLKLGVWHVIAFGVILLLFTGFQSTVRNFLTQVLGDSQYGSYADRETALNFSGFIIQICMFIFNLLYYKNVTEKDKDAIILYNLAFIGLSLQLFSSMIAEFFRLSYYFSFANILLVPLAISSEREERTKALLRLFIGALFIVYLFLDGVPGYRFFWV